MVPRAFSFHWNFILMSWKSNGIRTSLMKRDLGPIGLESEYDRQSFPLKLPLDVFLLQGNLRLYLSGFFFTEFLRVLLGFTGFLTRLHCRIEWKSFRERKKKLGKTEPKRSRRRKKKSKRKRKEEKTKQKKSGESENGGETERRTDDPRSALVRSSLRRSIKKREREREEKK